MPQSFISQESDDSDDNADRASSYSGHASSDSGSKIERILGRRVLANTPEAAEVSRRSRLAIVVFCDVCHAQGISESGETAPAAPMEGDLDNKAFEYLVKWKHQSYLHLSWLSYDQMVADNPPHGKSRLYRFVKMLPRDDNGYIVENAPNTPEEAFFNPNFCEVERVVACSKDMALSTHGVWQRGCREILTALCEVAVEGYVYIDPFMERVDEVRDGAPGYYEVVKHPMWVAKIMAKLSAAERELMREDGVLFEGWWRRRGVRRSEGGGVEEAYKSDQEFFADLELLFSNCHLWARK